MISPSRQDHYSPFFRKIVLLLAGTAFLAQASLCYGEAGGLEADPIKVLRKEHEIIRKVAAAAETTAEKIRNHPLELDLERIDKFHDFFKNFADRCHHAKEEDELFPDLKKVLEDATVVELLSKQHQEGRILLSGIKKQRAALADKTMMASDRALSRYLYEYAQLMYRHIDLENEYLWPIAVVRLSDSRKKDLTEGFHRIETRELGKGFHEKYHALAMELLGKEEK